MPPIHVAVAMAAWRIVCLGLCYVLLRFMLCAPVVMQDDCIVCHLLPQVPLVSLTEKIRQRLKSDTWGNYTFWMTFCMIGQPVSLLMYVHDYIFNAQGYGQLSQGESIHQAAQGALHDYLREA